MKVTFTCEKCGHEFINTNIYRSEGTCAKHIEDEGYSGDTTHRDFGCGYFGRRAR